MPIFHYHGHRKGGHAPGHIREAFGKAVDAFVDWDGTRPEPEVDVEVRYQARKMTISKVCGLLWNCSDIMPRLMVDQLAECLPGFNGGTYATGARAIYQWIFGKNRQAA